MYSDVSTGHQDEPKPATGTRSVWTLLAALIVTLGLSSSTFAGNSVRIGSANGFPGDTLTLPILATFDQDIQGFSIAARWQTDVSVLAGGIVQPSVAFTGLDFVGTASEPLMSVVGEFVAIESSVDIAGNANFTAGVIFDTMLLPSLPASPSNEVVIANAIYVIEPLATPETFQIDLSESVGTPAVSTTLSSFGQSLLPVFASGTIIVESAFELSIDSAEVTAGQNLDLFVRMENPSGLTGFQIVFTYDPDEIRISNLEDPLGNPLSGAAPSVAYAGTDLQTFINTNSIIVEAESLDILDLPDGRRLVSLSFIPDFSPPFTQPLIPASPSQTFMRLQAQALQPDVVIDLTNTAVDPPATNLVTLANGDDTNPSLTDGILYSQPANMLLQQTVVVAPNSVASVPVIATSPIDITGYSIAFSFNPAEADVDTTASPTLWMTDTAIEFDPAEIEFFSTNTMPGALMDGMTPLDVVEVLCIFDTTGPLDPLRRIQSGQNRIVSRIPLIVGNDFGGVNSTTISLEPGFLPNEVYVSGTTALPTVFAAPQVISVDVQLGGSMFIRGDTDVNGGFGIPDAIYLLSYLFTGGAEPPCFDAADVNDDEVVNLADAIGTLSFLFSGSTVPAPNPGCGPDPTPMGSGDNMIDCAAYPLDVCPIP